MENFNRISDALRYIDNHLDESLNIELLSEKYYLSPFYFHRLFSVIVGKSFAAYVRDRRILYSSQMLCNTKRSVLDIGLEYGYPSAQSFSRAFKAVQGVSPRVYRMQNYPTIIETPDELVKKFTNRLKGGIYVQPRIIKKENVIIAGTQGDGTKTEEVWQAFMKLNSEKPLKNAVSEDGYEIRMYDGIQQTVFVGNLVTNSEIEEGYSIMELPSSKYASFDVYVADGYDSENNAMNEWLSTNQEGYRERFMKGDIHYCVEFYDERFHGNEADSIVEIWIPIEKK